MTDVFKVLDTWRTNHGIELSGMAFSDLHELVLIIKDDSYRRGLEKGREIALY